MLTTQPLIVWLGSTSLSALIRAQAWIIPSIQIVHILAVAVLFTSIVMLDLRLLGVFAMDQSMTSIADRCVPLIWYVLIVLFISGALLITAEPTRALQSPAFAFKICALAVAAISTLVVHRLLRRRSDVWESSRGRRFAGKIVGLASLMLWLGVLFAGRWIAYVGAK